MIEALLGLLFCTAVLVLIVVCVKNTAGKKKTWTIDVDGHQHVVEVRHNIWLGNRAIILDGNTIEKSLKLVDAGSEHRFDLDGHPCVLKIRGLEIFFDYELYVDGKLV